VEAVDLVSSNVLTGTRTELILEFENPDDVDVVLGSIKPEISGHPSDRTSVNIKKDGNNLLINIDAKDSASFRASLNSYLRWIKLSSEILELKNI
jgi:KEOPS complex subunit Pcc1